MKQIITLSCNLLSFLRGINYHPIKIGNTYYHALQSTIVINPWQPKKILTKTLRDADAEESARYMFAYRKQSLYAFVRDAVNKPWWSK